MYFISADRNKYFIFVIKAELVGPVPLGALEEVVRFYLQVHQFSVEQIIESNLPST